MTDNPLSKYFRVPGIHVNLPSNGAFAEPGEIAFAMNGEIGVLPMTAADEVMTKNPDGLLNGHSIEKIIASCVPGVKNPRALPTQDIDVLLLAIKLTSYGDEMGIACTCPKCKSQHETVISIRSVLATAVSMEPSYSVRINDNIVLDLRPYDYEATTIMNISAFEEAKMFQSLVTAEMDPLVRQKVFADSFEKISKLNLDILARCVSRVIVPEGVVTDQDQIREFISNTDKSVIKKIQERMSEIAKAGIDRDIEVECPNEECQHTWTTELTFDPAHFFA